MSSSDHRRFPEREGATFSAMASPVTLQQLEYFVAAVEHGSFSAAAQAMHVAQPSLSEQIRRLEGRLGVVLFVRTSRRLVLTEAAQLLLPGARATLAAAEEAAEALRPMRTLTGGTVTFGTFSSAHHFLLVELVARFRERFPSVRVRMLGRNSAEVADAVRDGRLEAGLVRCRWTPRASTSPHRPGRWRWSTRAPTTRGWPPRSASSGWPACPWYCRRWGGGPGPHPPPADRTGAGRRPHPRTGDRGRTARCRGSARRPRGGGHDRLARHADGRDPHDRLGWAPLDPPMHETFGFVTRTGAGCHRPPRR